MAAGDRDPAAVLDLIEERAPKLRAAGVIGKVTIEGVASFEIAANEPAAPMDDDEEDDTDRDPLDDPDTFGTNRLPRLRRRDDA